MKLHPVVLLQREYVAFFIIVFYDRSNVLVFRDEFKFK